MSGSQGAVNILEDSSSDEEGEGPYEDAHSPEEMSNYREHEKLTLNIKATNQADETESEEYESPDSPEATWNPPSSNPPIPASPPQTEQIASQSPSETFEGTVYQNVNPGGVQTVGPSNQCPSGVKDQISIDRTVYQNWDPDDARTEDPGNVCQAGVGGQTVTSQTVYQNVGPDGVQTEDHDSESQADVKGQALRYEMVNQNTDDSKTGGLDVSNQCQAKAEESDEQICNGKIKCLIPGEQLQLSLIVLINAIYFKGDWENAFKVSNTKREPFKISKTELGTVEMMNMETETWLIGMSKSLHCQVLNLPYKGGELSMIIVLPNKVDGLSTLESSLSADAFRELTKEMYRDYAIVSIPKFKLESSFQLDKVLDGMGIIDIFTRKADFCAMMENPPDGTCVSDVIHKAFVEVNEEGTEAAAATESHAVLQYMPPEPLVFKADHPFIFFIRENSTGTVLFIGRFSKPTN